MMTIIDYRAGNLTSVRLAFEAIGIPAVITSDPACIRDAERIVFPGVGAAGAAMGHLRALKLEEVIHEKVRQQIPFLGICLGSQIILDHSEEDGGADTLGIVPGRVERFQPTQRYDKVPHMGWNRVTQQREHPLFEGIAPDTEFYFVHSYFTKPAQADCILGTTDYAGIRFASALAHKALVATQFHPEKSGRAGLRLLENFCRWQPAKDL